MTTRKVLESARPGLKDVSGSKDIPAPLEKVAQVLSDCSTKTEWVSGLVEERMVEEKEADGQPQLVFGNCPVDFTVYQHYTLLPLFSERDYVIHGLWQVKTAETSQSEGASQEVVSATLDLQSAEHAELPEVAGRVRASLNRLVYTLERLPNEAGTRVSVECNVDPLGAFPVFAVNLYASTWSEKTLSALQEQVMNSLS
ncbi:MAG: hypothetical protein MK135_14910 [Polyangiaceae bacterium]|nr:hypothetical protein [Polyangiaceae bacterium]